MTIGAPPLTCPGSVAVYGAAATSLGMDDEPVPAPPLRPPFQSSKAPRDNEPEEIELVRRWHEDRLQRKLRGEYESAVLHLADVVSVSLSNASACHSDPRASQGKQQH
jgi:hypothetical protein